jgi:hypothetical protein
MTLDQLIAQVIGPTGALVLLVVVAVVLWRLVLAYIADLKTQRDFNAVGWREQTTATNRVADAMDAMVRDAAARHRAGDS